MSDDLERDAREALIAEVDRLREKHTTVHPMWLVPVVVALIEAQTASLIEERDYWHGSANHDRARAEQAEAAVVQARKAALLEAADAWEAEASDRSYDSPAIVTETLLSAAHFARARADAQRAS